MRSQGQPGRRLTPKAPTPKISSDSQIWRISTRGVSSCARRSLQSSVRSQPCSPGAPGASPAAPSRRSCVAPTATARLLRVAGTKPTKLFYMTENNQFILSFFQDTSKLLHAFLLDYIKTFGGLRDAKECEYCLSKRTRLHC